MTHYIFNIVQSDTSSWFKLNNFFSWWVATAATYCPYCPDKMEELSPEEVLANKIYHPVFIYPWMQ